MVLLTDHVTLAMIRGTIDDRHVGRNAADIGTSPVSRRWPRRLPAEKSVDHVAPIGPPLYWRQFTNLASRWGWETHTRGLGIVPIRVVKHRNEVHLAIQGGFPCLEYISIPCRSHFRLEELTAKGFVGEAATRVGRYHGQPVGSNVVCLVA